MMAYNTEYRPDGNFYVRRVCDACQKEYFVHAMQNACADSGNCGSCDEEIWQLETMYGKHAEKEQR